MPTTPAFLNWIAELESIDDEGRILADNWRTDTHAQQSSRDAVAATHATTGDAKWALRSVLDPSWFAPVNRINPPFPQLVRMIRLSDFTRFHLDPSGVLGAAASSIDPDTLFADLDLAVDCVGVIGAGRPCWAAPSPVLPGVNADSVRDSLGLAHLDVLAVASGYVGTCADANELMELQYQSHGIELFRPTVAEAGCFCAFLPSDPIAHTGFTQDLRTGARSIAEVVHPGIPANSLSGIAKRGAITIPPSDNWKPIRLAAIVPSLSP